MADDLQSALAILQKERSRGKASICDELVIMCKTMLEKRGKDVNLMDLRIVNGRNTLSVADPLMPFRAALDDASRTQAALDIFGCGTMIHAAKIFFSFTLCPNFFLCAPLKVRKCDGRSYGTGRS